MDRTKGIGGSDVAAICGVSPWKTPLQIYLEKIGEAAGSPDNPAMAYGRMVEPVILQWYEQYTGQTVAVPGPLQHPRYPYLIAHLDGLTPDRVIEIKTARSSADWGDPGTDQIPVYYQTQVQFYMMMAGRSITDLPVSFHGTAPEIYTIREDAEIQKMLLEMCIKFWESVQKRHAPAAVNAADITALYGGKSMAAQVLASAEVEAAVQSYIGLQKQAKSLEVEQEAFKFQILQALGEADTLIGLNGAPLCTWKKSKDSTKFNEKQFQAEQPELFRQYLVDKPGSRRFLIKAIKQGV